MIYKLNTADEQDDAAFRARLAPLATEVLPPGTRAGGTPEEAASDAGAKNGAPDGGGPEGRENEGGATPVRRPAAEAPSAGQGDGSGGRSGWRRNGVALTAVAGVMALLAAAGLLSRWTGTEGQPGPRIAELAMPPVAGSAPAEERAGHEAMPPPVPAPAQEPDMIGLLLQRGDAAVADGDIIAARMLFERAASLGSATASTWAGKTYDIEFLMQTGARGIRADQSAAAAWYRRAAALGDPEARARLARIEVQPRP